ncbi:hypothetical protein ETAA8_27720 [Anatilimnocola aggregata]|uniref:DUF2330 domain-containing protein n=1 Tax=Anatilimnocola aggregata TaxID=2528021 RepID=A0A517YBP8_9BACT|nr:DUF2330 domain-containing protein [Anatilimnocola aggregata]QDU27683.1 hypothetical protein ETAA8_27720 [Anatilimnocola aggregata]
MSRALSACLLLLAIAYPSIACCPAPPLGDWVVNADQTVIMLWDPAAKKQHFIRKASFQSEADDFGFLIPSPSKPELAESGNEAFGLLHEVTAPRIVYRPRNPQGGGCNLGCSIDEPKSVVTAAAGPAVRVLEEKEVAGFNATVLEADNTAVLVEWLKDNGYAYSPEVAAWAQPYVDQNWKITALKVAKRADSQETQTVQAGALRLSFDTDQPLFPYREPDYAQLAAGNAKHTQALAEQQRLLRIYFVSNARYQGDLTPAQPWTGKVAWAGKLEEMQRTRLLDLLKLPSETGPAEFYLTEFEDQWPYKVAPADVYFAEATTQTDVRRPDVYVQRDGSSDIGLIALVLLAFMPLLLRRQ